MVLRNSPGVWAHVTTRLGFRTSFLTAWQIIENFSDEYFPDTWRVCGMISPESDSQTWVICMKRQSRVFCFLNSIRKTSSSSCWMCRLEIIRKYLSHFTLHLHNSVSIKCKKLRNSKVSTRKMCRDYRHYISRLSFLLLLLFVFS